MLRFSSFAGWLATQILSLLDVKNESEEREGVEVSDRVVGFKGVEVSEGTVLLLCCWLLDC